MYMLLLLILSGTPAEESVQWLSQYGLGTEIERAIYHEEVTIALERTPSQNLYDLRAQAVDRAQALIARAQEHYELEKRPLNEATFSRLVTVAARSHGDEWLIEFNEIMMLENFDEYMNEVIPHEVSHMVTFQMTGQGDPHHTSDEWRETMTFLVGYFKDHHHMNFAGSQNLIKRLREERPSACKTCTVTYIFPLDPEPEPYRQQPGHDCKNLASPMRGPAY